MREFFSKYIKPIFIEYIKPLLNKYVLTIFFFVGWMLVVDENDWVSSWEYSEKIKKLNYEIGYYEKEIEQSTRKKIELQSSSENLEKFAREQYLMKKANEDIFIIEN